MCKIQFFFEFQSAEKSLGASPSLQRRSMSPSPRRLGDLKSKKQTSLESNASSATVTESETSKANETSSNANTNLASDNGKFENISDNGSEISDEGYRSLGLIQQANNNQSKRASLHSQTSIEDGKTDDAKINGEFSKHYLRPCEQKRYKFIFSAKTE